MGDKTGGLKSDVEGSSLPGQRLNFVERSSENQRGLCGKVYEEGKFLQAQAPLAQVHQKMRRPTILCCGKSLKEYWFLVLCPSLHHNAK